MHSFLNEATVRKISGWCALVSLLFAMGMAFEYGRAMSYLHAGTLGLLAIAVPVAFVGADMLRAEGRKIAATMLIVAGTLMSIGEYMTHFGYTVGTRVGDAQQTTATNASYKSVQDNRASEAANLDMWKKQLAALMEQNAWAGSVKAEALRAQVALADKEVADETARGGCKAKCNLRMKEKADLEQRIGTIEQASDLTKRIEATQRILDKKVETATHTNYHSSKIVNQTAGFAQIAMWDDHPSDSALSWIQLVLGAGIAFITTYLTLVFTTVAFGSSKRKDTALSSSPLEALTRKFTSNGIGGTLNIGPGPARVVLTSRAMA